MFTVCRCRFAVAVVVVGLVLVAGCNRNGPPPELRAIQDLLDEAAGNGRADTIRLPAGTYLLTEPLTYTSDEGFGLCIIGAGAGRTILDGQDRTQLLRLKSTVAGSDFTIRHVEFRNGRSAQYGGALQVENDAAATRVDSCAFRDSRAGVLGGGVHAVAFDGEVTFTDCVFTGNTSADDAGGLNASSLRGAVTLTGNRFEDNHAGTMTLARNLLHDNTTDNVVGGIAVATSVGTLGIFHNTLDANAAADGGGISIYCDQAGARTEVSNNIIWRGTPNGFTSSGAVSPVVAYSDVQDGTGEPWFGTGCIDADPLFVNAVGGDYTLTSGSPCIDAGDPASPPDPDGTVADMGAFHFPQRAEGATADGRRWTQMGGLGPGGREVEN